jgi:hypothetical protein
MADQPYDPKPMQTCLAREQLNLRIIFGDTPKRSNAIFTRHQGSLASVCATICRFPTCQVMLLKVNREKPIITSAMPCLHGALLLFLADFLCEAVKCNPGYDIAPDLHALSLHGRAPKDRPTVQKLHKKIHCSSPVDFHAASQPRLQ